MNGRTSSNINLIGPPLIVTRWTAHPIKSLSFSTIFCGLSCRWMLDINERNIHLGRHVTVGATLLSASSSSRSPSPRHQAACDLPSCTTSRLSRLREQRLGAAAERQSGGGLGSHTRRRHITTLSHYNAAPAAECAEAGEELHQELGRMSSHLLFPP